MSSISPGSVPTSSSLAAPSFGIRLGTVPITGILVRLQI